MSLFDRPGRMIFLSTPGRSIDEWVRDSLRSKRDALEGLVLPSWDRADLERLLRSRSATAAPPTVEEVESVVAGQPAELSYREMWQEDQLRVIRRGLRGISPTYEEAIFLAQFFDTYHPDRSMAGRIVATLFPIEVALWRRNFYREDPFDA